MVVIRTLESFRFFQLYPFDDVSAIAHLWIESRQFKKKKKTMNFKQINTTLSNRIYKLFWICKQILKVVNISYFLITIFLLSLVNKKRDSESTINK